MDDMPRYVEPKRTKEDEEKLLKAIAALQSRRMKDSENKGKSDSRSK